MTKAAPLRNLTPGLCEHVRQEMLEACKAVAERHGLAVEGGDIGDVNLRHGFDIRFRVGIPLMDGALFEPEKAMFEVMADLYGLRPSDFGRTFSTGRETFRITAIHPNRPKYPISVERIPDKRGFKFTAEDVALYLSKDE